MFSPQQTKDIKQDKRQSDHLFFQPNTAITPPGGIYGQHAERGADTVMRMPQENYFFKPNKSPGNIIQRIPIPGNSNPVPGQQTTTQTQTPSLSHRQIPQGAISRADFEQYVTTYYAVQDVHNATKQEQEGELTPAKLGDANPAKLERTGAPAQLPRIIPILYKRLKMLRRVLGRSRKYRKK